MRMWHSTCTAHHRLEQCVLAQSCAGLAKLALLNRLLRQTPVQVQIPLPQWVLHVGEGNPDIFYTDRSRCRTREYISLGCDELPLFWGRSPVQMYCDFIEAFVDSFASMFGEPPLQSWSSTLTPRAAKSPAESTWAATSCPSLGGAPPCRCTATSSRP